MREFKILVVLLVVFVHFSNSGVVNRKNVQVSAIKQLQRTKRVGSDVNIEAKDRNKRDVSEQDKEQYLTGRKRQVSAASKQDKKEDLTNLKREAGATSKQVKKEDLTDLKRKAEDKKDDDADDTLDKREDADDEADDSVDKRDVGDDAGDESLDKRHDGDSEEEDSAEMDADKRNVLNTGKKAAARKRDVAQYFTGRKRLIASAKKGGPHAKRAMKTAMDMGITDHKCDPSNCEEEPCKGFMCKKDKMAKCTPDYCTCSFSIWTPSPYDDGNFEYEVTPEYCMLNV